MLLESIIQGLIANTEFVLLVAFLLGVLTSISPCPLATNIAAIAYISRDIKDPRHTPLSGLAYTLGRIVTYSVLGVGIIVIGMNVIDLSLTVQRIHGEILGLIMIAAGLFMVGLGHFNFTLGTGGGRLTEKLSSKAADYGLLGAFLIGVVFALAFCPYSAVLFFSGLIPLGLASESGVLLPAVYGLGTGIPVIIFSILFYLGVQELNRHVQNVQKIERVLRTFIGVIFVVIGLYYLIW
jgi:cytochrome c-type biogenesis protein